VIVIVAAFFALALLTHAGGLGVVRLLLAMLVVGSHVGGLGATLAGSVGICGFFAISGFLMARTIAANYSSAGAVRFYMNRFIRLAPPVVAVMGLSVLILFLRDGEGFRIKSTSDTLYMPVGPPASALQWFRLNWRPPPIFVVPSFYTLPQAWSLITESCFYLVAPLAAWLLARRGGAFVALAAAASAVLTALAVWGGQDVWLRSPLASFWIFGLGMLTYHWRREQPFAAAAARRLRWLATAILVVLLLLTFRFLPVPPLVTVLATPLLMLVWLWLVDASDPTAPRWGHEAGNWAYGVFLAHFLGTLTMYWIAETVYRKTGMFGLFGEPDSSSELRLVISAFLFALLFGIAVYYVVEKPFERLRAVIRSSRWIEDRDAPGKPPAVRALIRDR